jgi:N-acetylglucosaminyldiphosphoundecaprenol N-acetyl-beta-D-mannosaminyltransferase
MLQAAVHGPPVPERSPGPVRDDGLARVSIGGIPTLRITRADLARQMAADVEAARAGTLALPKVVVSSNGAVIARYHREPTFRALLDQADMIDADGMPLVLASRLMLKVPLVERVATTDFIDDACAVATARGYRFFFLGGQAGVAAAAAERLAESHPGLEVVGVRDGYFTPEMVADLCAEVVALRTDVLWVGLGSPLQEAFAVSHRDKLAGLGWIRTCGGLFDHRAGVFPRAPVWMQNIGLEWLHRATLEPVRLGTRYMSTNPSAVFHLLTKTHD